MLLTRAIDGGAIATSFSTVSGSPGNAANRKPSSSVNAPAACAAAISPAPHPNTTLGRIPTLDQSVVSAQASA